jgi:hypothetical protein
LGEVAKGFFVSGPYPLPQAPTPNPISRGDPLGRPKGGNAVNDLIRKLGSAPLMPSPGRERVRVKEKS